MTPVDRAELARISAARAAIVARLLVLTASRMARS